MIDLLYYSSTILLAAALIAEVITTGIAIDRLHKSNERTARILRRLEGGDQP